MPAVLLSETGLIVSFLRYEACGNKNCKLNTGLDYSRRLMTDPILTWIRNHPLLAVVCSCLLMLCVWRPAPSYAQRTDTTTVSGLLRLPAGHYRDGKLHQKLWGRHYRREWNTPVLVRPVLLDTAFGGLTPYEAGGGRQSINLKLHDGSGREYVLRSLDKTFGKALPSVLQGSFVEDIIDDQVTIAHPYSAFTIPPMAAAAGILHCRPILRYLPRQPALDSFNKTFANKLFLLEQRPDGDWSDAANFGNAEKIIGTNKLLEELLDHNDHFVDQKLYVRSRLFDLFIGDWGRHEDQWRWGRHEIGNRKMYQPIPRDRDQAYTLFDGLLTKLVLKAANLDHLQSFDHEIKDLPEYVFPSRHLDRRVANEPDLQDWLSIADDLQRSLRDGLIDSAVRQMPPEVFPISGEEIIARLRSRRDRLPAMAREYYLFLSRHVNVPGSEERELFQVERLNNEETSVKVFPISKDGSIAAAPIYSRVLRLSETRDVRLYGIGGQDIYHVKGKVAEGIKVRIVGGPHRDSIIDESEVADESDGTEIEDDHHNFIRGGNSTQLHLSDDSAAHVYRYDEYRYHKKGMKFSVFYDNPDRLYIGAGYSFRRHMVRKEPWGFEQGLFARYSLSQNAVSLLYEGIFYQLAGKWNLRAFLNQDFVRWTNFYGLGNETLNDREDRRHYQMRSNEFLGSVGLFRNLTPLHRLEGNLFFQSYRVLTTTDRFLADYFAGQEQQAFSRSSFAGVRTGYTYQSVDNPVVPEKGMMFFAGGAYTKGLDRPYKDFFTGSGILQLYVPLPGKFSLSLRAGGTLISGEPEFYQHASIGGSQTLRGYRRDRFWGKYAFYNTNELRWITDVRSYLMNGKAGLIAFVDQGRVWMPGEKSDKMHLGYGGGFLIAPFNFVTASVSYGVSEEEGRFHIRVSRLLQ